MTATTKTGTIVELEGLRGVASMWVLLGHWATTIGIALHPLKQDLWNVQAVDVFIILSGFVITLVLLEQRESFRHYIIRRFFRIVPIYWMVLAITVWSLPFIASSIAHGPDSTMKAERLAIIGSTYANYWPNLALHLALLHGLIPTAISRHGAYAFVGQAWSISLEWQFYLCAPLFSFLLSRVRKPAAALALIILTAGLFLPRHEFGQAYLGNKLHLFALGAISCCVWIYLLKRDNIWPLIRFRLACLAVLLLLAACFRGNAAIGPILWLAVFYVIVAARHKNGEKERLASWLLNNTLIRFFGRISYTLYLVHFDVMMAWLTVLEAHSLTPLSLAVWLLVGTVSFSVMASVVLNRLIEKRFIDVGRKIVRRERGS